MTTSARRKAPSKPTKAPVRRRPQLPITGFRIPDDVLTALDARVEALNAEQPIARVTRNALVVHVLREYCRNAPPAAVAPDPNDAHNEETDA